MKAKLFSQWGAEKGSEFWVGAEATVGRGADVDVRLDAKPVSSRHARLYFDAEAGAYFLEDLDSLNGTRIDGTPVVRTERLGRLNVLEFGGVCELLFVTVDTAAAAERAPGEGTMVDAEPPALPDALAADAVADAVDGGTVVEEAPVVLPGALAADEESPEKAPEEAPDAGPEADAEPAFVLVVIEGDASRRYALHAGDNLVGRTRGVEVALASRELSRRHAVLTVAGDRVTVRDLGSRNHTYLDDHEVGEAEIEVPVGSRLRFGLVEARLSRQEDEDEPTS